MTLLLTNIMVTFLMKSDCSDAFALHFVGAKAKLNFLGPPSVFGTAPIPAPVQPPAPINAFESVVDTMRLNLGFTSEQVLRCRLASTHGGCCMQN